MPPFGICHLSVVPLRREPSDKAEITTQLLFGEALEVLSSSEDEKWVQIRTEFEGYQGWMDVKQYQQTSEQYHEEYVATQHALSADLMSYAYSGQQCTPLLLGSTIPFFSNGLADLGSSRIEFKGNLFNPQKDPTFHSIEAVAQLYLSAPYLWGGKSPFGIDCSGFTQMVFKMNGIVLPRDAWQQAEAGTMVAYSQALPGDLAFFSNPQGKVIHVGILLGNRKIIHGSGCVRIDILTETGIFNEQKHIYTHKLTSIRRFLPLVS